MLTAVLARWTAVPPRSSARPEPPIKSTIRIASTNLHHGEGVCKTQLCRAKRRECASGHGMRSSRTRLPRRSCSIDLSGSSQAESWALFATCHRLPSAGQSMGTPGTRSRSSSRQIVDAWLVSGGCPATRDARAWWLAARPPGSSDTPGDVMTDLRTFFSSPFLALIATNDGRNLTYFTSQQKNNCPIL